LKPDAASSAPISAQDTRRETIWGIWAMIGAFGCYFCMYGFRRPFTAAAYSDTSVGSLGFKAVLVTSQVAGYMLSKFIGIKIIAELPAQRRARTLLWLVLWAEAALVLFALTPRPWNAAWLFLNGLSLGMVFGLVLGYLEGRRLTEALTAGLCASFILADGATKSIGTWLLNLGVAEDSMPCVAGILFLPPLAIFVAMLARVPPPSARDIAARAQRFTMNRAQRWDFLRRHAAGLIPLVLMYLAVTIVRSIRSDFAPEIWQSMGSAAAPSSFTQTELWVALGVLIANGGAVLISDNRRAFLVSLATCGLGLCLLPVALLGHSGGLFSTFDFMVLIGLGLYLPYVAVHTTVFERLLAITREHGNLGFLMYVADAVGYLGYVAVMFSYQVNPAHDDVLGLLRGAAWLTFGLSSICLILCGAYYARPPAPAANLG